MYYDTCKNVWVNDDYQKQLKKEKKGKTIKTAIKKGVIIGQVFLMSTGSSFVSADTLAIAIGSGILQGIKYNGNLKRGVKTGLAVAGVIAVASGVINVAKNMKEIDKLSRGD